MTATDIEKSEFTPVSTNWKRGRFAGLENTNQFERDIFVFLAEKQLCAQKILASGKLLL